MSRIGTFLLAISLSIPSLSQYVQNFEDMSKKEIKTFLLEQPNDEIQLHMKKYSSGQKTGAIFMLSGVSVLVATSLAGNKDSDPRDDSGVISVAPLAAISALLFTTGLVAAISSDSHFKKAKQAFNNPSKTNEKQQPTKEDIFENPTPELGAYAQKYKNSKKLSKVMWITAAGTFVAGMIMSDGDLGGNSLTKVSGIAAGIAIGADISAKRRLRDANKLELDAQDQTTTASLQGLELRDSSKIYHSLFQ